MRCCTPVGSPEPHRRRHRRTGRCCGGSTGRGVYTVAGADLYTSARILAAEQRLVAVAGRRDGAVVDAGTVDLALLETAANGTALDVGQAALVRAMCTSGPGCSSRLPRPAPGRPPLCAPWLKPGAKRRPSRRAGPVGRRGRAAPRRHRCIPAETLAKLTWSIQHGDLPEWATVSAGRRW